MKRMPPSVRTRQTITEALSKGSGSEDPLSELIGLAVKGMIETFARDPGDWQASGVYRSFCNFGKVS